MKHIIYYTENLLDGSVYVGIHSSRDPANDSYLGSGVLLKEQISELGVSNFRKYLVAEFSSREEAACNEPRYIAIAKMLFGSKLLNLHEGGLGGFEYLNGIQIQKTTKFKESQRIAGKRQWHNKSEKMSPSLWVSYSYEQHSKLMSSFNPASVRVVAFSPSGEITVYESVIDCVRQLGVGRSRLLQYLNGNGPTNHANSKWSNWKFIRESDPQLANVGE